MDLKEINHANQFPHPHDIARRDCLVDMLRGNPRQWVYADVGCGDQYITEAVTELTQMSVHVVDSVNVRGGRIFHSSVEYIDPKTINCLLLLDVLEHTDQPYRLMSQCLDTLADGGAMLITVPAYQFLWSRHDEALGHYRRYTAKSLKHMLDRFDGIQVEEHFYFFTSLLPIRYFQVLFEVPDRPSKPYSNYWPWPENHWITSIFTAVLAIDFKLNRILGQVGIRPPGLSLCFLCRKI